LNDDKRRKIKVGDTIEFIKAPENNETLRVQVAELRKYDTFKEMFEDIPFKDFDCKAGRWKK
jgi:ASC-1-like (ASCH) protein